MEQAFEWGNLTYVCYPYFWARGSKWDELATTESADPDFGRFLRAGSVRVVLGARPGFESAVMHWLQYGEPFLGDTLPLPGDPLYVSVATEIMDLTGAPDDGEAGECWETRIATPLVWLDPANALPVNEHSQLGLAPNAPAHPLGG